MKHLSYLILLALLSACADDNVADIKRFDNISFGLDLSGQWIEAGPRSSHGSDTLFYSLEEIPGSDYMIETVTLRGFNADKSSEMSRGIQIDRNNFLEQCTSFSVFSTAEDASSSIPKIFIDNDKIENISPDGGEMMWKASSDRFWPDEDYQLSFYAVSPYIEDESTWDSSEMMLMSRGQIGGISLDNEGRYLVERDIATNIWTLKYTLPTDARKHKDIIAAIGRQTSGANSPAVFPGNWHKPVFLHFRHLLSAVQVRAAAPTVGTKVTKVSFGSMTNTLSVDLDLLDNYLPETSADSRGLVVSRRGTAHYDFNPGIDLNAEGKTDLATGEATFLMIPQRTGGIELTMNFTEVGSETDNEANTNQLSYTLPADSQPWVAGTTTIYTLYPKSITLELKDLDNNTVYADEKRGYKSFKTFEVPDDILQQVLPKRDPHLDIDNVPDQNASYEFKGWVPVNKYVGIDSLDKIVLIQGGETVELTESTAYRPIFLFSGLCGITLFWPNYEARDSDFPYIKENGHQHSYASISGFVNEEEISINTSSHNQCFLKYFMVDGVKYDYPGVYTLRTTFKNVFYVFEGRFTIIYDTGSLSEEMPESERQNFAGGDVKYYNHLFEVSSWKKDEIIWKYTDKNGEEKTVEPGGMININDLKTDNITLHAEPL